MAMSADHMQPFTGNGDVSYEWKILEWDEPKTSRITITNAVTNTQYNTITIGGDIIVPDIKYK